VVVRLTVARRLAGAVAAGAIGLLAAGELVAGCARPAQDSAPPRVAERLLLAPEEFGEPGWRVDAGKSPSQWVFAMPYCGRYEAADYPAQRRREAVATRYFVHRARVAHQLVEHFAPGWAARSVEDTRRVVTACARYEHGDRSPGAPGFLESHWIEAEGFAGDESVLIGTDRINPSGGSFQRYTAVVRVGDLVMTLAVRATEAGAEADADVDPERVRELARRAAAHLDR
jgi:hypothetical protein